MSGRRRWMGVVLVAAMGLAACGGDDEGGGSAASGEGSATNSALSDEPDYDLDATLRLAGTAGPTQWDPHNGRSLVVDNSYMAPVYDRLLIIEPDDTVGPRIATSWEFTNDNRSLTFVLRSDVTFHDGTPLDAAAVKANIEYTKAQASSISKPALDIVESVTVVDPATLRLDLNSDGTNLPLAIASSIGVGGIVNPSALAAPATLATTPAGSGPYRLVQQLQDRAIYERVPGYWDTELEKRAPQRLELAGIPDDNARMAAVISGQLDGMTIAGPIPDVEAFVEREGLELYTAKGTSRSLATLFNMNRPQLSDLRVRRALSMAIDREAITANISHRACFASIQPFTEDSFGYNADVQPVHDSDEAKRLLTEAGADGLALKAMYAQGALAGNIATAIQAQWAEVGVTIELMPIPPAQAQGEWRTGNYDMFLAAISGGADPTVVINDWYTRTNALGAAPPELVDLTATAEKQPISSPEREKAWQDAVSYIGDNAINPVVCVQPPQYVYRPYVVGIENSSYGRFQIAPETFPLGIVKH